MSELVFFDMDGTLAAPRFQSKNGFVTCFPDEEWIAFCEEKGEAIYDDCLPVRPVERYARKRKADGANLFVLTTSQSDAETASKGRYVQEHFPGLFEEIIAVPSDKQKIPEIRRIAEEQATPLDACELVEDTFAILFQACEYNIRVTHVAQLVCDL